MLLPVALTLAIRTWLARPLRPILCALAIAASVGLVVCVGAAMDSLRHSVGRAVGNALGVAEAHVRPTQRETDARVDGAMLEKVRAYPEVDFAGGRITGKASLTKIKDEPHWYDVVGIDVPLDDKLRPKIIGSGRLMEAGATDEILIDTLVAKDMELKVGDVVAFRCNDEPPRDMKVVGIIQRPTIEIIARPVFFVPIRTLWKDLGVTDQYNVIDVKLKDSAAIADFDQYAKDLKQRLGPSVDVAPGTSSRGNMADMNRSMRLMLLVLSTVAALCASLIIGTTLSVGVQERIRQFGQLRCIGASRGQLASFLLADALVMLVIGDVLGGLFGVGLSKAFIAYFSNIFESYQLSTVSLVIALGCGALATMVGSLIPIWQVTRVSPMAAVTSTGKPARMSPVKLAGAVGLACILVQQLIWWIPASRDVRVFGYVFAGIPLIFCGWCLLAPIVVTMCEGIGSRIVGPLMGVRVALLRHAWSRTPWRTGAMIASLMVGVTLFTTVRARGRSLFTSWKAPQIPDLVVKSMFGNLSDRNIERLQKANPELKTFLPFDYFTVSMKSTTTTIGKMVNEEQTTFVAVRPAAFAEMLPMNFVQGEPTEAIRLLEEGKHVFVTKEFNNVRKLGVGDPLTFQTSSGEFVDFRIAAVVESTGVEVVKNYFDLRASFGEKAVSSVLGNLADGKKYFKMGEPTLALINVTPEAATPEKIEKLRTALGPSIQSLSSVEVKGTLSDVMNRITNGLSVIGLGALIVASLGVANMVIASIHARRFEFGVLRAIGAGRSQLVRLVLAETTLVAIIAGVLGTGAGLLFAFMGSQLDYVVIGFSTNFIDPVPLRAAGWAVLLTTVAIGLTTLLGWLAALVPALKGAMSAQRTLLAGGRS